MKMVWLYRCHPATALGSSHVAREFEALQREGGGERMLTETMILECSPEQGIEYGFVYFSPSKAICGIVKAERKEAA